ncbi:MAG: phosphate ABC transporter substrate-binding/OmpA family protein [Gemmatimonadota bacterium]|nr:phosphate ABC transporter substrate-binding/OmpA family protein [Gemmatimonadota bacterium]
MADQAPRFTFLGKLLSLALIGGLFYLGYGMLKRNPVSLPGFPSTSSTSETAEVSEAQVTVPVLAPAAAFQLKVDSVVPIEISEYAGYAGLIVANGGLEPGPNSLFTKYCGCRVKLSISEEESWSSLNSGKLAGSVTTTDVLAVYGRQFKVKVPAQIGFSRGADGVLVRNDIRRVNALKGKVIAAAQFTETDFFIRYLAQEAGLGISMLGSLDAEPSPSGLNLVYTDDGFAAGDLLLADVKGGKNRVAGAVTWEPKTSEVMAQSGGALRLLTTNKNLLIIADVLVLNKGFAEAHPRLVEGLVHALLEGNRMVRDNPEAHLTTIATAFKWSPDQARAELAKVHLSNLPENLAFFRGEIDAAGSFGGIFQSAVYAYGSELIRDPADPASFVDLAALQALDKSGLFKDQKIAIAPIRSGAASSVETDPLLSKDIRFLFQPNSTTLDLAQTENLKNLEAIKQLLTVSPGSTVLLRGHVDNAMVEEFRKKGGDAYVRQMALRAVELSRNRAAEIQKLLVQKHGVESKRVDIVGRGWDEPAGTDADQNRRVEVQWFTLE